MISLVGLTACAASAQQVCIQPPAGLVAWWPGDGSGEDLAGTNDATLSAGFGVGIVGPAFQFDAVDDYVEVPNSIALQPDRELTVAGWFRVSSFPVEWLCLFFKGNLPDCPDWPACSNRDYAFWVHSSGKAAFTSTASGAAEQTEAGTPIGLITAGQWHHLAAVINCNSGYMKVYIDGTEAANVDYSTNGIRRSSEPLFLGSAARIAGSSFNGLLDEFTLFNTALTATQIVALHAAGRFGMCKPQSLPRVVIPPASQCVFEGENVVLIVAASGAPLFYQWRRNGLILANQTNSFVDLIELPGDPAGAYDVLITNNLGSATSAVANVSFVVRPNTFSEGFECLGANNLPSGWTVVNGLWQAGLPSYGPPPNADGNRAFAGANVAATVLDGDYDDGVDVWLLSPEFTVPVSGENPRLCFWHWFSLSCADSAEVFIRSTGGQWQQLTKYESHSGNVWTRACFDLAPFGEQTVQIGFRLFTYNWGACGGSGGSDPDVSAGWYIDDIEIVTGPIRSLMPNIPEGFENGWGDWHVEGGTWQIGVPTFGPDGAAKGTNVAATLLDGNYYDGGYGRLVSPAFLVPSAIERPRLWFRQWYEFNYGDAGGVKLKTENGDWTDLSAPGTLHRFATSLNFHGTELT